ncbi:MAG: OmpH family outer membrane protein [Bacteroidaceae bacterium]|nr:OmpH family outer membrane protein [Bacteroidaceae bacterium]
MKKILIAILMMAPMSLCAQKFAHFNSADIIPNMKEYTTAMEEVQNMEKQYQDDLKLMQDELQKKSEEYQKEQANLLPNVRERREQELNDLYTRLQQSYQDNQVALQKAQAEKMNEISEKVLAVVKKLGEAGGYVYIVDTSAGVIPYVSTTLSTDITNEVKKELGIQ